MTKILFTDIYSSTLNNGYWSDWIQLSRGCHQGCPFSALCFTATVETLGIKLRANVKIQGINMGDFDLLCCQYADDMWLALNPTAENINEVIHELELFSSFSGLIVNYDKTVAFKLGPLRDTDTKYYTMKKLFWFDGSIRMLGIQVHPDWNIMHDLNYTATLKKVERILDNWTYRNLTLIDKIALINSTVASLFTYKFMCIPSPHPNFFKQYKTLINKFLWGSTVPRIRYNKLIQNVSKGGLKLVDLQAKDQAIKASWLTCWK